MFPATRQSGLSVQPLGDELVIIDLERRDVFRLNSTAAWLWERCDGRMSVHDLAVALRAELPDADEDTVWSSLRELSDSGLLEIPLPAESGGISRRKLLATVALIGGAGVIAPLARGAMPAAAAPVSAPERATGGFTWKMGGVYLTFSQPGTPVLKWGFSHLEGLGAVTDVTSSPSADGGSDKQTPGKTKWTPIVLKRGITSDMSLWKWQDQIASGDPTGIKSAKMIVVDTDGKQQLAWNVTNAWPDNLTILPADAGGVVYEQVEIVLDSSERYK